MAEKNDLEELSDFKLNLKIHVVKESAKKLGLEQFPDFLPDYSYKNKDEGNETPLHVFFSKELISKYDAHAKEIGISLYDYISYKIVDSFVEYTKLMD